MDSDLSFVGLEIVPPAVMQSRTVIQAGALNGAQQRSVLLMCAVLSMVSVVSDWYIISVDRRCYEFLLT